VAPSIEPANSENIFASLPSSVFTRDKRDLLSPTGPSEIRFSASPDFTPNADRAQKIQEKGRQAAVDRQSTRLSKAERQKRREQPQKSIEDVQKKVLDEDDVVVQDVIGDMPLAVDLSTQKYDSLKQNLLDKSFAPSFKTQNNFSNVSQTTQSLLQSRSPPRADDATRNQTSILQSKDHARRSQDRLVRNQQPTTQ